MVKIVNATEAKNRFGDMIQRAYLRGQHLIIKRGDIPVVAIVPISDYEKLIPQDKVSIDLANSIKEDKARKQLLKFLDKVHKKMPQISEDEANQDIQKAIYAIRKAK